MRIHSKAMNKRIWHILIAVLACAMGTVAQKVASDIPITSMTLEENLAIPKVNSKQKEALRNYMRREAQALAKMGYTVETDRNGEVIVVTLPASQLFLPNETSLTPSGIKKLEPLLSYLKAVNRFKLLAAMHSDNTGSENYKEQLTTARVDAVMHYIHANAEYPAQAVGYAMADDEPLRPNTTRANREKNRRLEIYIVPGTALLERLKK